MVAKKVKPLGDGVDLTIGDFGAAAFFVEVVPDVI